MDSATRILQGALTEALSCLSRGDYEGAKTVVRGALDAVEAPDPESERYVSQDCPWGWETAVSYLHRTSPRLFDLLADPSEALAQDEMALVALCAQRESAAVIIRAPAVLAEAGRDRCLAFPVFVLRSYYGE